MQPNMCVCLSETAASKRSHNIDCPTGWLAGQPSTSPLGLPVALAPETDPLAKVSVVPQFIWFLKKQS